MRKAPFKFALAVILALALAHMVYGLYLWTTGKCSYWEAAIKMCVIEHLTR